MRRRAARARDSPRGRRWRGGWRRERTRREGNGVWAWCRGGSARGVPVSKLSQSTERKGLPSRERERQTSCLVLRTNVRGAGLSAEEGLVAEGAHARAASPAHDEE